MFQQHVDYSSDAQHKDSPLMLDLQIEIQINSNLKPVSLFVCFFLLSSVLNNCWNDSKPSPAKVNEAVQYCWKHERDQAPS